MQAKQELNRIIEFYSLFFDINNMKKRIEDTSAKSQRFLEYISKMGRRLIENSSDSIAAKDIKSVISDYKNNRKPDDSN